MKVHWDMISQSFQLQPDSVLFSKFVSVWLRFLHTYWKPVRQWSGSSVNTSIFINTNIFDCLICQIQLILIQFASFNLYWCIRSGCFLAMMLECASLFFWLWLCGSHSVERQTYYASCFVSMALSLFDSKRRIIRRQQTPAFVQDVSN